MQNGANNIYRRCRVDARYTREAAAEMISVSVRSLADYEAGRTVPGDDIVCKMIEVYGAPELPYLHLKHNTEVGRRYLPDLFLDELPKSVLRFQRINRGARAIEPDLVDIACDGVIEQEEIPAWNKAKTELNDLVAVTLALLFHPQKNRPLEAARQKLY